ncbi:helix-turn-helix transcriptional regulator [Elizabethkingia meningoseptica]|uniref:winged helix-turn-helix transcriptional regulator n=1 Tax=Elizabethkingia meningoseptica TaxID=238 RepID=UPI000332C12D|nr:helix-turn-helix domain-containing protein [Elizabethkingia meningoseptica]AQX05642.1 transcriptional regulator [Elizabethkingia meningoseptica]AQX47685.1 transcriptional regulator [Elizabethkingia meningoseptica]EJK5328902.1 helix-turn-helix transcriptional regulator [Elizabethkingia meningoseptica]EOR30695.1 HxlR family transcriptional regulator [Elizabethkingia meningoseptica ATCC 13253 = NBRC 12535]KUY24052.1 transcriptional regulator [Elizabethkingia meningoseptica]
MTTNISNKNNDACPAEEVLKLLSGKWKPQIFRLAAEGSLRFSNLLRQIEGSNKQSIATALKELEAEGLLIKNVIKLKPLHIEYTLSERGKLMLPVFQQLEKLR